MLSNSVDAMNGGEVTLLVDRAVETGVCAIIVCPDLETQRVFLHLLIQEIDQSQTEQRILAAAQFLVDQGAICLPHLIGVLNRRQVDLDRVQQARVRNKLLDRMLKQPWIISCLQDQRELAEKLFFTILTAYNDLDRLTPEDFKNYEMVYDYSGFGLRRELDLSFRAAAEIFYGTRNSTVVTFFSKTIQTQLSIQKIRDLFFASVQHLVAIDPGQAAGLLANLIEYTHSVIISEYENDRRLYCWSSRHKETFPDMLVWLFDAIAWMIEAASQPEHSMTPQERLAVLRQLPKVYDYVYQYWVDKYQADPLTDAQKVMYARAFGQVGLEPRIIRIPKRSFEYRRLSLDEKQALEGFTSKLPPMKGAVLTDFTLTKPRPKIVIVKLFSIKVHASFNAPAYRLAIRGTPNLGYEVSLGEAIYSPSFHYTWRIALGGHPTVEQAEETIKSIYDVYDETAELKEYRHGSQKIQSG